MNQKKRMILASILLVMVVVALIVLPKWGQDKGAKEIKMVFQTEDEIIYENRVHTDAAFLSELLEEMAKEGEIKLQAEDSDFGMFITGIGVDKLIENDNAAGLYWMYTSENNAQCQEGFCDGADILKIQDGDNFVFTYGASY